jgi:hypothetical protein
VSAHCGKRESCNYDMHTWNTVFCREWKEIHVEKVSMLPVQGMKQQTWLKDLDERLGCYHPKCTKVYDPAVWTTTGKCSAEPKLKKGWKDLGVTPACCSPLCLPSPPSFLGAACWMRIRPP